MGTQRAFGKAAGGRAAVRGHWHMCVCEMMHREHGCDAHASRDIAICGRVYARNTLIARPQRPCLVPASQCPFRGRPEHGWTSNAAFEHFFKLRYNPGEARILQLSSPGRTPRYFCSLDDAMRAVTTQTTLEYNASRLGKEGQAAQEACLTRSVVAIARTEVRSSD